MYSGSIPDVASIFKRTHLRADIPKIADIFNIDAKGGRVYYSCMMHVPQDRRRSDRREVHLAATIVFRDGVERVAGCIRNISQGGARVEVPSTKGLPDELYLLLPEHKLQPCRIMWRSASAVGVQYVG